MKSGTEQIVGKSVSSKPFKHRCTIDAEQIVGKLREIDFDKVRYYKDPLIINGVKYYLCSQWYEHQADSLIKWLTKEIEKA